MDMKAYVISLLQEYNNMILEMDALQFELKNLAAAKDTEMIEALTFSFPDGDRVQSGKVTNKTQGIALTYVEKFSELKEQATCEINSRLQWLTVTVKRLDYYINKLEAHQASIIRDYYFERYSWRDLQELRGITYKTLIKYRNDGIKILVGKYQALEQLGLLEDYNTSTTKLQ